MQHEPNPLSEPAQPDPPRDQDPAARPSRIGFVQSVVIRLLDFGRHLATTITQRAEAPSFPVLAVAFGTARVSAISAHLHRGILRAIALQRVLHARLAAGRDLEIAQHDPHPLPTPSPLPDPSAAPEQTAPAPPAAVACRAARRRSPPFADDPELFMPTLAQLEAQIRRRPIGRTIVDICLDLGVVPGFCVGRVWNMLFECIHSYGGSLDRMWLERERRRLAFTKEWDQRPIRDQKPSVRWWDLAKDGERQALGFLLGETPVNPFAPPAAAAIATGPP